LGLVAQALIRLLREERPVWAIELSRLKQNSLSITNRREAGFSLIEIFVVATIIGVLTAIAIPQLAGQRRLIRSAAVPREVMTQLRYARQQAMSQRQSFTFQYNNTTKQIIIIDNNASGATVLNDSSYPNNSGSSVVLTSTLTLMGLASSEVSYGIPSGLPTGALADGVSRTSLTSSKINVTFQPDGSVVDANGNPIDRGLFFYNSKVPNLTAAAISVLGASGRIKLWKYNSSTNTYVE
jgi:prepilin-type N-terminal cleavage/methylation domain-containing protein